MPSEKSLEKAAQLWYLPQHSNKIMDAEFAKSIATALDEARNDAIDDVYKIIQKVIDAQVNEDYTVGVIGTLVIVADAVRKLKEKP